MVDRNEVIALMYSGKGMKAVGNNDNTGFSVLLDDVIMADVDQLPVPPGIVWSELGDTEADCYEVYYIPPTGKNMKRAKLLLELDMTSVEAANALKDILVDKATHGNLWQKNEVIGIIGEIKAELGEEHFPDYYSTAAYYVRKGTEDVYYIWIGYDTHDPDNVAGRTRNNLIIECSCSGYKYRFSRELFSDTDESLDLELTDWVSTDTDDLREEVEQYIYICKYNSVE